MTKYTVQMSKKTDTIEIQTSSIDSCNLTDVDLKQTKSRSVHCKPMGMHRNEIRS